METEIIRVRYNNSYIEFFDHSFGEGLSQDEYSLFSIELNDARIWLRYQNQILKVGEELPMFYQQANNKNKSVIALRKEALNQTSDYVFSVQFEGQRVRNITASFD